METKREIVRYRVFFKTPRYLSETIVEAHNEDEASARVSARFANEVVAITSVRKDGR